uniref:Uncharacterized protein n=1 Tax=Chromera velia CCMP2878 TaxID=1169474 RepID=A0A0G4G038_9ALVE|mmetsp:Transcript_24156/g.47478  ORF Transcript_24156/g.47478 Transcript_24156/m.47478 type:complete len:152 (-) Transcript_24156:365-820(-)|eukprot:Cvel_528.t1-p1 / transcript=Cvel_528.t1 / gene=Cvel_528 / organism=Chromera_velia_CCMP2878 / gene_product=hypothetical protein / transcript_product=hypothetical protein / location=Cvel_scaffold16:136681-137133(-) / protein_length=151 / sequence_SO=supercontig / SO=protein_coding / is_pseudo=false
MGAEVLATWVLGLKIGGTLVFATIPVLLFPRFLIKKLLGRVPEPILYFRLLGWAWVALLVGYTEGLVRLLSYNEWPDWTLRMGIVSNGGATCIVAYHLLRDRFCPSSAGGDIDEETGKMEGGSAVKIALWGAVGFLGAITTGLAVSLAIGP